MGYKWKKDSTGSGHCIVFLSISFHNNFYNFLFNLSMALKLLWAHWCLSIIIFYTPFYTPNFKLLKPSGNRLFFSSGKCHWYNTKKEKQMFLSKLLIFLLVYNLAQFYVWPLKRLSSSLFWSTTPRISWLTARLFVLRSY